MKHRLVVAHPYHTLTAVLLVDPVPMRRLLVSMHIVATACPAGLELIASPMLTSAFLARAEMVACALIRFRLWESMRMNAVAQMLVIADLNVISMSMTVPGSRVLTQACV